MARDLARAARERSDLAEVLAHQEGEASLARLQQMSEQTGFQLAAAFAGNRFSSYDTARPISFGHMHNYLISSAPTARPCPEMAKSSHPSAAWSQRGCDQSPGLSQAQEALAHHRKMQSNTMQQNAPAAAADADVRLTLGTPKTAASCTLDKSTQQLTMFYAGKISVYDNMPVHKAQAIMLLAGSIAAGSSNSSNIAALNLLLSAATGSKPSSQSVLPQARKASLARFLEKRKERCASTSPYPSKSPSSSPSQSNNDQEAALNSSKSNK